MNRPDRGEAGDCCTPSGPTLTFPAGRFEEDLVSLIVLLRLIFGFGAVLQFLFWLYLVLGSWYHPWMLKPGRFWEYFTPEFYPGVLELALLTAVPVILLNYLYE